MRIDIWSDIVCPWCYVGKRRLERALAGFEHRDDVEVTYRSFLLDPGAPETATETTAQALARRYGGGEEQVRRMMGQVRAQAAEEGLRLRLEDTLHVGTRHGHRLLHAALAEGGSPLQAALKEALLDAYFGQAEDVGDPEVLRRVAVAAGLGGTTADEVLTSDAYSAEVDQDIAAARRLGATGVPFAVVDRRYGISGAQPVEVFRRALEQACADTHPTLTTVGAPTAEVCGPDGCSD